MMTENEQVRASGANAGVLVISRTRLLRDRIAHVLQQREMSAVAISPDELIASVSFENPPVDAALVDARDTTAAASVQRLTQSIPPIKVILFGAPEDEQMVMRCIQAGATGYLDASCNEDEMCAALHRIRCDDVVVTPHILAALIRRMASGPTSAFVDGQHQLTVREKQVFALMEGGLSNKEIAGDLHISVATVKHHVHRILEKFNVPRRSAAIAHLRRQPAPPVDRRAP